MVVCPRQVSVRWVTAIFGCFGFLIIYGLRVNLSVAVLAMVNHTALLDCASKIGHEADVCYGKLNSTLTGQEDGPFVWDENIQGLILGSYFYGYIFTQILGGVLGEKYSAKHVYGVGVLLNGICTMLSPPAARGSYMALMALRIIMGAAAGMTLPAMHVILAKWAPPQERSKISSTVYAGTTLGTLLYLPFSGFLASELGWEWIFYIHGAIALVFYIMWIIFIQDSPDLHPMISSREKSFISTSLGESEDANAIKRPPLPIKSVFSSGPVWGIIIAHTCNNWGWYMLLVKLPTYMKYIFHFDIKANGFLSALPYLTMWIFTIVLANILDYLRGKGTITTTTARKFSTFIASIPPGLSLICASYIFNTTYALTVLFIGMTCLGGIFSGFLTNHIDVAPPFAGTLMGISNTVATIPGILVPSVVGYMTKDNQTIEAWRTIFFITMGIFTLESAAFLWLGSGETQDWARKKKTPENERLAMD